MPLNQAYSTIPAYKQHRRERTMKKRHDSPPRRNTEGKPREDIGDRMRRVRRRGTSPELVVRALLGECGIEADFNARDLPGSPDLVVRDATLAIFVHGCFWHRH